MFSSNNLCVMSWGGWLLTEGWGVCVRAFFTVRILVWFQQLMFSCRLPVGARFPLTQLFCPLLGPSKMVSGGHCCPNQQNLLSFLDQLQIGYWKGGVWDVLPVCTTASFASNFGVVPVWCILQCSSLDLSFCNFLWKGRTQKAVSTSVSENFKSACRIY